MLTVPEFCSYFLHLRTKVHQILTLPKNKHVPNSWFHRIARQICPIRSWAHISIRVFWPQNLDWSFQNLAQRSQSPPTCQILQKNRLRG